MGDDKKKVKICRVCLGTNVKKCMSLFEIYKDCLIYDYVNTIANVKIQKDDGFPDKICLDCLLELETAIHFKEKCESSNVILQSAQLEKLPVVSINNAIAEVVIKKEEPFEEPYEYLEEDVHFLDSADLLSDANDTKLEDDEGKGFKKSRAIDLKLECHDCGNFFKSKCKLRVHWKKVHLPEALICSICKRMFKSFKAFNRHLKSNRQSCKTAAEVRIEGMGKNRIFHCKECNYKSKRIKDIQSHLVIHTGDRPYHCDKCPAKFTQQSSLQCHQEGSHKLYKVEITCQYCGKFVRGRSNVYRHLKTHTDNQHQCQVCSKILQSKKSLATHMQRHSGVKQYTCEVCAKSFYTGAELCNHKRMIHMKGKYWYFCDVCEYKSIRSEKVKKHKAKHTATNIPCIVCGMFFEMPDKLIQHQRKHFGEKKFPCPLCDKRFFRKDTVGKHIRSKHKCQMPTILVEKRVVVKKEAPIAPADDLIEIELSPVIEIK
ncbi:zinc finger protein 726-like [Cydia splendana]|uniref:zinc finger protein 726-like n=1 Tax=Cydia splendana TaxID=1100963 RepID=UPI00300D6E4A